MSTLEATASSSTVSVQTNMRCNSCLSKVRAELENSPEVLDWSADLSDPRKIVTAKIASDQPFEVLQRIVKRAGYVATPLETQRPAQSASEPAPQEDERPSFSIATYRPLLLVIAYVAAFSVLMCWASGVWTASGWMRYFMGGFFLGFAFFKLLDVSAFADAFSTYDVVAKQFRTYAVLYPFIELGLGAAYVLGLQPLFVNSVTALAMGVGLVGVVAAVRRKQAIQCACLGAVFNLPMSAVTVVENSVMVAMATLAIFAAAH